MLLKVLSVAFPFASVGPHAVGGAEQVLSRIDRALVAAGHTSIVVACEGSETAGELFSFPLPTNGTLSWEDRLRSTRNVQTAIDRALAAHCVDLIHLHGLHLEAYSLPADVPVLISLHLPAACYPPRVWSRYAGRALFCCASESHRCSLPAEIRNCAIIEDGVPLPPVESRWPKGDFALVLGRICSEKNAHEAFDAGSRAGLRVLLAGEVLPFPEHQQYFRDHIEPRVRSVERGRPQHAFLGRLQEPQKQALLARAKCLLHPTLAPETSSLVAMEALAAGTPVIAYRSGAIPEIVEDGVTGFLVDNVEQMAEALRRVHLISSDACRAAAQRRFSASRMIRGYFDLYEAAARRQPVEALCI